MLVIENIIVEKHHGRFMRRLQIQQLFLHRRCQIDRLLYSFRKRPGILHNKQIINAKRLHWLLTYLRLINFKSDHGKGRHARDGSTDCGGWNAEDS